MTIIVPLPEPTRAKTLCVEIKKRHILAKSLLAPSDAAPFIEGDLFNDVVVDESTWSVVDGRELSITLEKVNTQEWWPHVVTGAPKIDVRRIAPETSRLSELDSETRATVEKMMFDQKQQQMGKPTSEEMRKQEILKKFQAQHPELDFSQADIEM